MGFESSKVGQRTSERRGNKNQSKDYRLSSLQYPSNLEVSPTVCLFIEGMNVIMRA